LLFISTWCLDGCSIRLVYFWKNLEEVRIKALEIRDDEAPCPEAFSMVVFDDMRISLKDSDETGIVEGL